MVVKLQNKTFSISIVGVGKRESSFGWKISRNLININGLERLILFDRKHEGKSMSSAEYLKQSLENTYSLKRSIIQCAPDYKRIMDSDITIVCVDASRYMERFSKGEKLNRIDVLEANIPSIISVAEKMRGYHGSVIVATNPTDFAAYIFRAYSGLVNVQGFNHIDTFRFRNIIADNHNQSIGATLKGSDIEGFVVGPHNELMEPMYSTVSLGGYPFVYSELNKNDYKDPITRLSYKEKIRKELKEYGTRIIKEASTSTLDVGPPMKELVEAIIFGEKIVESSIFFKLSDYKQSLIPDIRLEDYLKEDWGIFMGIPVKFVDRMPHIKTDWALSEEDQKLLAKSYSELHKEFEQLITGVYTG